MIQLATDPQASRSNWRPAMGEAKEGPAEVRRGRAGHAWPFISRPPERPAGQPAPKSSGASGS